MLIVFTEMILTTFLDFHIVDGILQQKIFVPCLKRQPKPQK